MRNLFLLLAALWHFTPLMALEMPDRPMGRVNDYAKVLSPSEVAQLEERSHKFEAETSNQIVIAIFPTLGDEDVDDFTNRLFIKWKLGQQERNNGVLIAVFHQDRKVRIEVGYGLEGVLTDALASEIIRNEIAPAFRQERYAEGLMAAVNAIDQATRGEYQATKRPQTPVADYSSLWPLLIIVFLIFMSQRRRRKRGIFIPSQRGGCGYPIIFSPGSDEGWGRSGGWGGGGGGGGGFSGGGGSSGGGGASGSW